MMFASLMPKFTPTQQAILKESFEITQDYSDFLHYYTIPVEASLLVLGDTQEAHEFARIAGEYEGGKYQVGLLSPQEIVAINGHLGAFEARILIEGEPHSVKFAQMVLFYEDENLLRFMGCENAGDYADANELLGVLDSRLGDYTYRNIIFYDANKCQYHHRREDKEGNGYCHQCADVCPTFGVGRDDSLMELKFSALDCISCGACVSVCPSGAVQRDGFDKESLYKIAKLYRSITPVVCNERDIARLQNVDFGGVESRGIESRGVDSSEGDFGASGTVLPLAVAQVHLLNEVYLLTLVQESGSQVVVFDPLGDVRLESSARFLNEIFQKIYKKDAVFVASNLEELQAAINLARPQEEFFYTYAQDQKEALRNIFAQRLMFMVRDGEFGKVENRGNTYGRVFVDEKKCTLCLGCVGACNVQSLSAGDFALMHNPSLCTACGYCADSCPEGAISLDFSGLELSGKWFERQVMAKDAGFRCVECGKVFANQKAVEKIKAIMLPIFGDDALKIRTLECCEACKVKVMFGVS